MGYKTCLDRLQNSGKGITRAASRVKKSFIYKISFLAENHLTSGKLGKHFNKT
jgi:hypothetical protein